MKSIGVVLAAALRVQIVNRILAIVDPVGFDGGFGRAHVRFNAADLSQPRAGIFQLTDAIFEFAGSTFIFSFIFEEECSSLT